MFLHDDHCQLADMEELGRKETTQDKNVQIAGRKREYSNFSIVFLSYK